MSIYLAGPMTGIPQFNFPLFTKVTAILREQGHEVVNPAETDTDKMQELALKSPDGDHKALLQEAQETWGEVLANDVRIIADEIGELVMLPGWERSKGARLEAYVAMLCDKPINYWRPDKNDYQPLSRFYLLNGLMGIDE